MQNRRNWMRSKAGMPQKLEQRLLLVEPAGIGFCKSKLVAVGFSYDLSEGWATAPRPNMDHLTADGGGIHLARLETDKQTGR